MALNRPAGDHQWGPWASPGTGNYARNTPVGLIYWLLGLNLRVIYGLHGLDLGLIYGLRGLDLGLIYGLRRLDLNGITTQRGFKRSQILVQADRPEHFLYSRSVLRSSSVNPYSRFSDHRFSVLHRHTTIVRRHLFKPRQTAQNRFKPVSQG